MQIRTPQAATRSPEPEPSRCRRGHFPGALYPLCQPDHLQQDPRRGAAAFQKQREMGCRKGRKRCVGPEQSSGIQTIGGYFSSSQDSWTSHTSIPDDQGIHSRALPGSSILYGEKRDGEDCPCLSAHSRQTSREGHVLWRRRRRLQPVVKRYSPT